MKKKLRLSTIIISLSLILIICLFCQQNKKNPSAIYLVGGNLIDCTGNKLIKNSLVIIEGERIIYAGQNKPIVKMAKGRKIDCKEKFLLPGLFDTHVHLWGSSVPGYISIDINKKLKSFLYCGITSIYDLAGIKDQIFDLRESEKIGKIKSPHIFTVGPCFTSPGGHGTEFGIDMAITPNNEGEAREAVKKLSLLKPNHIKIIYEKNSTTMTSLSYKLMEVIIDEAHQNNLKVITHISTLEQAKDAVKAGTDGLGHMVIDKEVDEILLKDMKEKNVFCIPTLSVFEASCSLVFNKEFFEWPLISKGVSQEVIDYLKGEINLELFLKNKSLLEKHFSLAKINLKKMVDAEIKIVLGTDAGNPVVFFGPSVHHELELMVDNGLTPIEAIKSATKNAAEILGEEENLGTIEKGKIADILIVDMNPLENIKNTQKIFMVIKNGFIYDRDILAKEINPSLKPIVSKIKIEKDTEAIKNSTINSDFNLFSIQKIQEAMLKMKSGIDLWDTNHLKNARDIFFDLLVKENINNTYILYYIALCDFRLSTYFISINDKKQTEKYTIDGKKYLEKIMQENPSFGESYALYASFLGYELAVHQEKAMLLGFKIVEYYSKAFEKDPNNPRINLLKGISLLHTPKIYGGGPDNALIFLEKSIILFKNKKVEDPIKPSWGEEEAFTFLGMVYKQKKEDKKAEESFKKALEINPNFRLAENQLRGLSETKKNNTK